MDDLAARVLDAIEEREQTALNAGTAPWVATVPGMVHVDPVAIRDNRPAFGSQGYVATVPIEGCRNHVADNDPPTVLRRCAADRRIVDMYLTELRVEQEDNPHRIGAARMWGGGKLSAARIAVVLLADGYGLVKADDVFGQMAFGTEEQPETDPGNSTSEEE